MLRLLQLALLALALLLADAFVGAAIATAEAQETVEEARARRSRRARRARRTRASREAREVREAAARNARETDAPERGEDDADERADDGDEASEATSEAPAEEAAAGAPSLSETQSRRLDFDARVIRGETAGRGAIVLFERGGRSFAPLARVRRKFLLPTILAVFGEEPARPAEDER